MPEFFSSFPSQQVKPVEFKAQDLINIGRTGIAYQREEQGNKERLALQDFFSNPENFQTDGRIDIDKVNAKVPQLAPLTGRDVIRNMSELSTAQTQAISAKQNLTQDQRKLVGQTFNILGKAGVNDRGTYLSALDDLVKTNPENKDLARLVDSYKTIWGKMPENTPWSQFAQVGGQSLLSPSEQEQLFGPKPGTISTGAATFPTITQPSVAGLPPRQEVGQVPLATAQLPPGSTMEATGRVDMNNQPTAYVRDQATGRILGEVVIPGGAAQMPGANVPTTGVPPGTRPGAPMAPQAMPQPGAQTAPVAPQPNIQGNPLPPAAAAPSNAPARIPPGETPETGRAYQEQIIGARGQVQPAGVALNNIRTVRQYLPLAQTGATSETIAKLQSVFGNVAGSKPEEFAAAARDIIEKNIADLALQKNSALGGKFAADLNAVQSSLSSAGKNPTAIAKVMDQLEPLMQHVQNYSIGLNRAIERNPNKIYAKPAFDNAMNEAFDIRALMMKNAFDNGGKPALDKFVKENNINVRDQQVLLQKLQRYGQLLRGEL